MKYRVFLRLFKKKNFDLFLLIERKNNTIFFTETKANYVSGCTTIWHCFRFPALYFQYPEALQQNIPCFIARFGR